MFSRLAQYLMSDFKGTPEKWAKIGMSQPDYWLQNSSLSSFLACTSTSG